VKNFDVAQGKGGGIKNSAGDVRQGKVVLVPKEDGKQGELHPNVEERQSR